MKIEFGCNVVWIALSLALLGCAPADAADFTSKHLDVTIQSDYMSRSEYSGPLANAFGFQCRSPNLPSGADLFKGSVAGFRAGLSTENQNPITFGIDPSGAIASFAIIYTENQPSLVDAIRSHSMKMEKGPVFKYLVDRELDSVVLAVIDIVNRIAYGVDFHTGLVYHFKSETTPLMSPSTKVTSIVYCVPDITVNMFSKYIPKPLLLKLKATVQSN